MMGAARVSIDDYTDELSFMPWEEELSYTKPKPKTSVVDVLLSDAPEYVLHWEDILMSSQLGPGEKKVDEGPLRPYIPVSDLYRNTIPLLVNNPAGKMREGTIPSEELGPAYFTAFMQELFTPAFHPFEEESITSSRRRLYHALMAYAMHELSVTPAPHGDTPEEKYVAWKNSLLEQSQAGMEAGKRVRENLHLPPKNHDTLAWVANSELYDRLHAALVPSLEMLFDKEKLDCYLSRPDDAA